MDDLSSIDINKLQHRFIEADAELRASFRVIEYLERENAHLREVIHKLADSKSPSI